MLCLLWYRLYCKDRYMNIYEMSIFILEYVIFRGMMKTLYYIY